MSESKTNKKNESVSKESLKKAELGEVQGGGLRRGVAERRADAVHVLDRRARASELDKVQGGMGVKVDPADKRVHASRTGRKPTRP